MNGLEIRYKETVKVAVEDGLMTFHVFVNNGNAGKYHLKYFPQKKWFLRSDYVYVFIITMADRGSASVILTGTYFKKF